MTIEATSGHTISEDQAVEEMTRAGFVAAAKDYAAGSTEPHQHDYDVCLYVIEGTFGVIEADSGVRHSFKPGDKAYVPSGTRHSEDHGPVRIVVGRRHH